MRKLPLPLLLLLPLSSWCAITDQPTQSGAAKTYDEMQAICRTLLYAGAQGNITALSSCYTATTNNDIREAITAANGLYWILRQQLAESDRYAAHLRKNFTNSKYQFLLEKDANFLSCTNCLNGIATVPCQDCIGTGKCRACGGRGKVPGIAAGNATLGISDNLSFGKGGAGGGAARSSGGGETRTLTTRPLGGADPGTQQPCAICGGNGTCKSCKGTKLGKGRCPFCQSTGSILLPARTLRAYADMLEQVQTLAFAAAVAERGMIRLDGRWLDRATATRLLRQRNEELAYFRRATADAECTTNYTAAFQLLDNAMALHPDSTYTADVQRVKALLRTESENKKLPEKAFYGPDQLAAARNNPRREIGIIVDAVLTACRRGTNAPLLIADSSNPILPTQPEKWQIGEPELLNRVARVNVQIDRPNRSGFLVTEPWEFRLIYAGIQWQVWLTIGP